MDLEKILAGVETFNKTAPALSGLILSFRHQDGHVDVLATCEDTETIARDNIAGLQALIDSHKTE